MKDNKRSYTLQDIYEQYDNPHDLDKADYIKICRAFNYYLVRSLIETGYAYKLPHTLGTISIRKRKGGGGLLNFKHYNETGEKVYLKNKHSEGYYCKWI